MGLRRLVLRLRIIHLLDLDHFGIAEAKGEFLSALRTGSLASRELTDEAVLRAIRSLQSEPDSGSNRSGRKAK